MTGHEEQIDAMLAAIREVPREDAGETLAMMLFVGTADLMQDPSVTTDRMSEIAQVVLAKADRFHDPVRVQAISRPRLTE